MGILIHSRDRLTVEQFQAALRVQREFSLKSRSDADIISELEQRANDAARYASKLDLDDFEVVEHSLRLSAGIAYEKHMVDVLAAELELRAYAKKYGYGPATEPHEQHLSSRFAALRERGAEFFADLIERQTGQRVSNHNGRRRYRCPFHSGGQERTPSLTLFDDAHAHWFGCGWHGDVAAFVAESRASGPVAALRLRELEVI